jgi:UDP-N-acetylglucosamine transferase subunit ALG13
MPRDPHRVPSVFVTVGTDHHRFDRLISWTDDWLADRTEPVRVLVQHGTSTKPAVAEGRDYLPYGEMIAAMQQAHAVVCHGGPATIMESRQHGRLPIIVPRRPELDEHVDDHQVRFTGRVAQLGQVLLAGDEQEYRALLERALADPGAFRLPVDDADVAAAVQRFSDLVAALFPVVGSRGAPR